MRRYFILTVLGMLLVIVALLIIIIVSLGPGIKFTPDWVKNVIFIWLMFLAGYVVFYMVKRFKN